jgi:hypothetical protein
MNAYELADELKECIDDGSTDLVCVCGAVNMLRQQADRIAELEKECNWAKDQWNKDRICFEASKTELEKNLALKTRDRDVFREFTLAYEKRIAELEKTIQDGIQSFGVLQEQMLKEKLFGAEPVAWIAYDEFGDFMLETTKEGDYPWQPLYTTPQIKELSDEEIIEIGNAVTNLIDSNEGWIEFARAILKKASAK